MNKILIEVTKMLHFGAFLAMILLLRRVPITRSFHIVNHQHQHQHQHQHRPRQQQQLPQPQNCRMSFSNSKNCAQNNVISNSSPVVLHEQYNNGGSTQHNSKNNNHDRRRRPFDNESLDDAYYREEEFSAIRMNTNRKFESSMENGWRGLNEIYCFPSITGGGCGGCDDFMLIPNDEILVSQSKSLGATTVSSSPTPSLNFEEDRFNENNSETIKASLPLILQPKDGQISSPEFLRSFLEKHREWIEQQILQHGAVVVRGFSIENTNAENDTNEAIRAVLPGINNDEDDGFEFFYVSNIEVRSKSHFSFESVYPDLNLLVSPKKQQIKAIYGQTTLTNFRKVYHDLPPRLRTKLLTKKLLYQRAHQPLVPAIVLTLARIYAIDDATRKKSWFQLFGTTNKRHTEQLNRQRRSCTKQERRINDKNTFTSEFLSEAFQLHPKTKEWVFLKHAHRFHWTTFPAELFRAFRRTEDVKILGHALLVSVKSFWKYSIRRRKTMPVQVTFGDGKSISIWEMHQIRKAVRKNMIDIRLQGGDLLIIDGHSTSIRDNKI
jgi:hypothetical protein